MPDSINPSNDSVKTDDKSNPVSGTAQGAASGVKEKEPANVQDAPIAGIQERGAEADEVAEREIKSVLKDARLSAPEPSISEDLKEAGVKSPQREASEVIKSGAGLQIPLTETEFQQAQHAKFSAKVTERKDVIGVSSIIALAMWVGRLIKLAHKHTMKKIVFRKGGSEDAT